jgi:putative membrane protein (TIGR04086 family)
MFNAPLIIRPNVKALGGGIIAYALLYWISTSGAVAFSHLWFPAANPGELKALLKDSFIPTFFAVVVVAQYFVPGFVAGFMARRAGLMHGLITGAFLPIVTLIFMFNEIQLATTLVLNILSLNLIAGLLFCSIAGVIGEAAATNLWERY